MRMYSDRDHRVGHWSLLQHCTSGLEGEIIFKGCVGAARPLVNRVFGQIWEYKNRNNRQFSENVTNLSIQIFTESGFCVLQYIYFLAVLP